MGRFMAFLVFVMFIMASGAFTNPLFNARTDYDTGDSPFSVFASDLDGDGDNDLALANWYSDNVSILKNNGDGSFQAAVNYGAGAAPFSIFSADFDGDGDFDLAVANGGSGNVSILFNRTIATDIEHEPAGLPIEYRLSQNYPNPFNAQTTISYSLPTQSDVTIDIFDILGRKIETIAEGLRPAGDHQVIWDASDRSSGIYFYRIKAGDKAETKKMTLMK